MKLFALLMMAVDLNGQPLPDVVLLDFTAGYCQPCRQMVPVLQNMEKVGYPIRKIDITEHPDISRQYRVDRIPTLILLVEGQEVQRFQGVRAEGELRRAMNDAARKLEEKRQPVTKPAREPNPFANAETPAAEEPAVVESNSTLESTDTPRTGLRGMFDKVRQGFGGSKVPPTSSLDSVPPEFRAQSPENGNTPKDRSLAMRSTVRVRLMDGNLRDVGTGTIVQSMAGQSTILTCAHIFQKIDAKTAAVEVDVFRDGKVLKYPAQVLGGDHGADVAFLRIQNVTPLVTSPMSAVDTTLQPKEAVFSIGCSNGDLPTRLNMNVIEVDRYDGPQNILCTNDPTQGRSGGGLFNARGEIVGVCSAADRDAREGLYAGIKPVRQLLTQLKLNSLFDATETAFVATESAPKTADAPPNPFESDDDLFDDFFNEAADFSNTDADAPAPIFTETSNSPGQLPDPFGSAPAVTTAATSRQDSVPTEITVIIDDPDPTKGKRVIVIPRPSPWLLELLTGDKPAADTTSGATARERELSTTSARRSSRRIR